MDAPMRANVKHAEKGSLLRMAESVMGDVLADGAPPSSLGVVVLRLKGAPEVAG